jgi:alpha-1,3-rhamnosyl/mannosyltransferase
MRVGMNLLWLRPGEVGGTESYATRLIAAVSDLAAEQRPDLALFVLPAFGAAHPGLVRRWPTRVSPAPGRPKALRVAAESTWLPLRTGRLDLVHHLGGTIPLISRKPAVLTIHDLQFLDLPENFSTVKRAYLGHVVPRSVSRASVVTTVSEFVRQSVIDHLEVTAERVAVVPHVVLSPEAVDPAVADGLAPVAPFFLFPGIAYPHKNHAVVIDALADAPGVHLVCTGLPWSGDDEIRRRAERRGVGDRVHQLGLVDAPVLGALYERAAGLVFPSRYEGFGAPVVEAMQRGCPVLAADATALPEVVGDAGLLLPPDDPSAWSQAMLRLIDDAEQRATLIAAGRIRAEGFRPEVAAAALVAAYALALR